MGKALSMLLTPEEKAKLESLIRSSTAPVRDGLRSRIVLLAAEGKSNQEIAVQLDVHRYSVALWRQRFAREGLKGLQEKPRRGRKRIYAADMVETIIGTTLGTKPRNATHWSPRTLVARVGTSHSPVHRIWSAHQIKPHLLRTFKLAKDPHCTEKLRDVVGLYLDPPEHALVLSVDEKSGFQALDRTQPGLPLKKGRCGPHDARLQTAWHHYPVCRLACSAGGSDRLLDETTSAPKVPEVLAVDRSPHPRRIGPAPDYRQLCDP